MLATPVFSWSCAFVSWWDVGLLFRFAQRYPLIELCSSGSFDDERGRGSLEERNEAEAKPELDEIGLSYCSRYFFVLPCPVTLFVDCTVRERMFVAPKHASIRCCASVCICTDWCCTVLVRKR
jgi:hypothetical protein